MGSFNLETVKEQTSPIINVNMNSDVVKYIKAIEEDIARAFINSFDIEYRKFQSAIYEIQAIITIRLPDYDTPDGTITARTVQDVAIINTGTIPLDSSIEREILKLYLKNSPTYDVSHYRSDKDRL